MERRALQRVDAGRARRGDRSLCRWPCSRLPRQDQTIAQALCRTRTLVPERYRRLLGQCHGAGYGCCLPDETPFVRSFIWTSHLRTSIRRCALFTEHCDCCRGRIPPREANPAYPQARIESRWVFYEGGKLQTRQPTGGDASVEWILHSDNGYRLEVAEGGLARGLPRPTSVSDYCSNSTASAAPLNRPLLARSWHPRGGGHSGSFPGGRATTSSSRRSRRCSRALCRSPVKAIVLYADEKPSIQAPERAQDTAMTTNGTAPRRCSQHSKSPPGGSSRRTPNGAAVSGGAVPIRRGAEFRRHGAT